MKLLSFLGACALAALAAQPVAADSGKGKPGYCDDDTDCYDKNYACVSVQTTRSGVENVKQCLRVNGNTPICTGVVPGLCPSFSTTWGSSFRQISSVCAYIFPQGKNIQCIKPGEESVKGAVECLFVQDPDDPNNSTATVGVIYGCVDFDGSRLLFKKNDLSDKLASKSNYSEVIDESCVNPKNPAGSTFVCSSQGTCAPNSAGAMEYSCKCNIGFSGMYCEKIIDNQCYNDGVCGGGSCDLANNVCTECPAGTTGNKCAYCDPTYDATKVCSKHGKCVAAGSATNSSSRMLATTEYQCECDTGYSDTHCAIKVKTPASSNTTPAPATPDSWATSVKVSISAALIVAVAAFTA